MPWPPACRSCAPTGPAGGERGRPPVPPFWIALALPGMLWLAVLFIVPFYAVLSIGEGKLNKLFDVAGRGLQPAALELGQPGQRLARHFRGRSFVGPIVLRTIVYVAIASALCLLIAYPAAYFVARFAGRRKGLFLVLLIAPFWVSYMMRMLAWIDLLQTNGYVNKVLTSCASPAPR